MCLWAAATEAAPHADKAQEEERVDDVEEFENELDAMVVEDEAPSEEPPSPRKLRCTRQRVTQPTRCTCTSQLGYLARLLLGIATLVDNSISFTTPTLPAD